MSMAIAVAFVHVPVRVPEKLHTYTPGGKLDTRTWARGVVTFYDYNNAGDLILTDYADSTPDIDYYYNRRGEIDQLSDGTGWRDFSYNSAGEQFSENVWFYGSNYYASHTYDNLLRQNGTYLGDTGSEYSHELSYQYDGASRLNRIYNEQTENYFNYYYEPNSNLIKHTDYVENPETILMETISDYDNLDRKMSIVSTSIPGLSNFTSFEYSYNSLNQREQIQDIDNNYWAYQYDNLGQVISGNKKLPSNTEINGYDFSYELGPLKNPISPCNYKCV